MADFYLNQSRRMGNEERLKDRDRRFEGNVL